MKKIFFLLTISLLFTFVAFGDVRLPDTPTPKPTPKIKQTDATMRITLDKNATETVLKLNKSSLKQLRAAIDDLDDDSTDTRAEVRNSSSPQTIIGGLFLSLAFVFGGVWMFRAKPSKTVIGLFLIVSCLITTTFVFANIAPPMGVRKFTSKTFSEEVNSYGYAAGNIKIQIGDGKSMSKDVELIVPAPQNNNNSDEE
jgi:hypothetical protein